MAQTRRMGKCNQRADRPKAPRFSPHRNGQITPTDLLVHSPFRRVAHSPRLLDLTRMGVCRTKAMLFRGQGTNSHGGPHANRAADVFFVLRYCSGALFSSAANSATEQPVGD